MENPIDKDKVADLPGLLEYAHHVGSALIKPEDKGKIKSRALTSMRQQTEMHVNQVYKQMKLLLDQMNDIKTRVEISEQIYNTELPFEPIVSHIYHLYRKDDGKTTLSIIAPNEWGRGGCPFSEHVATVKLLADHTWDVLELNSPI
jgi:hypothetical protein